MNLKKLIRDVPDFPKPGIIFKDITPLLADAKGLDETASHLALRFRDAKADVVFGIDARGFIIGVAVALKLGLGFVPVRKKGKLP